MNIKYILGLSLATSLFLTACNDDDINIYNDPLVDASSVVTGSSDVTSTTATLYGTVSGLQDRAAASYGVGFYYTTSDHALSNVSAGDLSQSVTGSLDGTALTATLTDLMPGTVIYYQTYVTLSATLTFRGEIKSLVTTDATVKAAAASSTNAFGTTIDCSFDQAPEGSVVGVTLSTSNDMEAVRDGLHIAAGEVATRGNQAVVVKGLVPSTTYYYAPYVNVGPGEVFGEVQSFTTPSYDFDVENDLVDLGLSVKWAKYNVGATSETEFGGLYGFGDVTGVMSSINPEDYGNDGADTYKSLKDVAAVAYKNKATLPSAADWEELFSRCSLEWTTTDGVAGFKVTGPNGNSIFLPAAGSRTMNEISDSGAKGYYLTGSAGSSNQYYTAFEFSNDKAYGRSVLPVYQAVAARAISNSRNVPFVEEYLYNTWYLENNQDGQLHIWEGPFTQYGVTDTWGTVTNGENNPYQSIYWPVGLTNEWLGYKAGFDHGYMTLNEDGTVEVGRNKVAESGEVYTEVQTGKFTVDKENKTITIDIPVLCADTWIGGTNGTLNILSLDEEGMQIALVADDTYAYAANYYSDTKRFNDEKIPVTLLCVGGDWNGTWGDVIDAIAPADLDGYHTASYTGAVNGAMVFTIDFGTLKEKNPNAMVVLTDIKCDGQSIPFDGTKLFYGDIENNGNFRIELFNIWGKGSVDGLVDSPFSTAGYVDNDPAFSFAENVEFTYYIATNPMFTISMVNINAGWGGSWGTYGGDVEVKLVDGKYEASPITFDAVYNYEDDGWSGGFAGGSMLAYIDIANLYAFFPATETTLNSVKLDGKELTGWDPSKIYTMSADGGGVNYRIEMWNCWGPSANNGCAFGTPEGDIMPALGFNNSFAVNASITPKMAAVNF